MLESAYAGNAICKLQFSLFSTPSLPFPYTFSPARILHLTFMKCRLCVFPLLELDALCSILIAHILITQHAHSHPPSCPCLSLSLTLRLYSSTLSSSQWCVAFWVFLSPKFSSSFSWHWSAWWKAFELHQPENAGGSHPPPCPPAPASTMQAKVLPWDSFRQGWGRKSERDTVSALWGRPA